MDERTVAEVRRLSRELLGSSYRLEVATAIANAMPEPVYARGLKGAVEGANDNQVSECLKHFEAAGLLHRLPTRGGREPQMFAVADSAYWRLCAALHEELVERLGN